MRKYGGWENWKMVEVEKYPCGDVYEAASRERYWYEHLNATLNSVNPYRSKDEVIQQHKDYVKANRKHISTLSNLNSKKHPLSEAQRNRKNEMSRNRRAAAKAKKLLETSQEVL